MVLANSVFSVFELLFQNSLLGTLLKNVSMRSFRQNAKLAQLRSLSLEGWKAHEKHGIQNLQHAEIVSILVTESQGLDQILLTQMVDTGDSRQNDTWALLL